MSRNHSVLTWRLACFSIVILLTLLFWLHRDTIFSLIRSWNDLVEGDSGHGYLVLLVSIFIIFRNKQEVSRLQPCPSYLGVFATLIISFLWLLSIITSVVILQSISLLLLILSVTLAIFGKKVTRKLLFPILFVGFAIPFWEPITPLLRNFSAEVVFKIIRFMDIPAFLEETRIILPSGRLTVTDGCSGTRYAIPAIALGILYSYLNYQHLSSRFMVVFISLNAAILINIIRILIVVYFAYQTEMQHYFVHNHFALGWYLFAFIVITLLFIDIVLNRYFLTPQPIKKKTTPKPIHYKCTKTLIHHLCILLIVSTLLISTSKVANSVMQDDVEYSKQVYFDFPEISDKWKGPISSKNNWVPTYRGSTNFKKTYQKKQELVDLYIGYYPKQGQGKELIFYTNRIGNKDVWHLYKPTHHITKSIDHSVIEQLMEKDNGEKRLVWYWYQVAGHNTTSAYIAKGLQVLGVVTGNTQASVTAISVIIYNNIESSRNLLEEFMSTIQLPMLIQERIEN